MGYRYWQSQPSFHSLDPAPVRACHNAGAHEPTPQSRSVATRIEGDSSPEQRMNSPFAWALCSLAIVELVSCYLPRQNPPFPHLRLLLVSLRLLAVRIQAPLSARHSLSVSFEGDPTAPPHPEQQRHLPQLWLQTACGALYCAAIASSEMATNPRSSRDRTRTQNQNRSRSRS